jgi:hypothetical protein
VRAWVGALLSTLPGKIVAAATGVAAVTTTVFLLDPGLQPVLDHCHETARGDVSQVRIERGTWEDYLVLSDQPTGGRPRTQLSLRGNIVLYKAVIQGFKHSPVAVRFSVLDAKDDELIHAKNLRNNDPALTFSSPRCSLDQFGAPLWIPAGIASGKKLYAEILLYDVKDSVLIESARSPAFYSPKA